MRSGPRQTGFTLIEVLTAMMVLAIGLSGVISLIYGSTRAANVATDRNVATALMQEALAEIQRNHLITPSMVPVPPASDVGLYVETWDSSGNGTWPNLKNGPYTATTANLFQIASFYPSNTAQWTKEVFWPSSTTPRYYGGPMGGGGPTGTAYRVLYKLERHPNWLAGQLAFENIYVLTMTVYKDLNPAVHPHDPKKRVEQVSDPTVVYLNAKGMN